MRNAGQHQPHRIRDRQPDRGKHGGSLSLNGAIDAGLDKSVCSHALHCNAWLTNAKTKF
jgi:hypothetical protein